MAIAKSTELQEEPRVFQPHVTEGISNVPTVSWDIMRFFNVDMHDMNKGNNEEQLKDIEGWAFKGAESLGDGLMRLKRLDIQLGTPQDGETRISRIYSWIKMEKAIEDLKLRQRAL